MNTLGHPHELLMTMGMTRRPVLWKTYLEDFPNLTVEIIEDFNPRYNCIAWSIGINERWVWNEIDFNSDGEASLSEFIDFYRKRGYTVTSNETDADVALFGKKKGLKISVKHAARRDKELPQFWSSKMGQGAIIRHRTLSEMADSPYGVPIVLFKRL